MIINILIYLKCFREYHFGVFFLLMSLFYSMNNNAILHHKFMKKIYTILILILSVNLFAQTSDSVFTAGGKNSIYYSFANSDVASLSNDNWELGFTTKGFNASVIINEAAEVKLFLYSNNASDWTTVDTTGKTMTELFNSHQSWTNGAFNRPGAAHPDYGWGIYNMANHHINGTRVYVAKLISGAYKKIWIEKMSAAGIFTVKIANLDGSDEESVSINKNAPNNTGRNYILYHVENKSFVSEPLSNQWDLLFSRYIQRVSQGPITQDYLVYGVKVNDGYQVAIRNNVPVTDSDTNSLVWYDSTNAIGGDWKRFDRTIFQYVISENLTFFVRGKKGEIWKVWFTDFMGGQAGQYNFNFEVLNEGTSSVSKIAFTTTFKLYPNPTLDNITINNEMGISKKFVIYNNLMQKIQETTVEAFESKSVDVSILTSGIYFMADGVNTPQKFIVK